MVKFLDYKISCKKRTIYLLGKPISFDSKRGKKILLAFLEASTLGDIWKADKAMRGWAWSEEAINLQGYNLV